MLEGLTPPSEKRLCKVMVEGFKLDDKNLQILLDNLADERWSNNALADALTARGFIVSEGVIRKHRSKKCCCVR